MIVLASASLWLAQSLWRLQQVSPGFSTEGVVSINMNLASDRYPNVAETRQFQRDLLENVRAMPGVRSAGLISGLPFSTDNDNSPVFIDGNGAEATHAFLQVVDTELFRTLSIPLLAGRNFADSDDARAVPVAMIDAALAKRVFGQQSPVGRRIATPGIHGPVWREIIGVVGSIKRHQLSEQIDASTLYLPSAQSPVRIFRLVVASKLPVDRLVNDLRAEVTALDPEQPIWGGLPIQARIDQSLQPQRQVLMLVSLFSGLAIMLCVVGLYAALSMTVSERTAEIGLRVAVGARPASIVALVLREGLIIAGVGAALGLMLALLLAAIIRSRSFGFEIDDALLMGLVTLGALLMVVASAIAPALRAAKLSPVIALRR